MTTYIYSVTMSLLSRTLQSILSKYILDVDVEGIALPSLFVSSSTTNGSNNNSLNGSGGGSAVSGNNDSNSNDGWGVRLSNVKLREGVQLMVLPGKLPRDSGGTKRKKKAKNKQKTTSAETITESTGPATQSIMREDSETALSEVHFEDGTENSYIEPNEAKTQPVGWFSSWFRTSSTVAQHREDDQPLLKDDAERSLQDAAFMPPSLSTSNGDDNSINGIPSHYDENEAATASYPHDLADDFHTTASFAGEYDGEDIVYDDNSDGDEENVENDASESPLILKLGRDGTIGILDVRLVGKTIHVMIEDADLTIEVVRQSANVGTDASSISQQQQQAATKKKSAPDQQSTLKTTGDRVLAENIIARYLSIVPNLFLRDIRIRLVIRSDESVSCRERDASGDSYVDDDTIIEVVIGLFSVNDGKDFLLNFAGEVDNDVDTNDDSTSSTDQEIEEENTGKLEAPDLPIPNREETSPTSVASSTNEFLTKRIRTGRGPEGGIVVRIYPATKHEYLDTSLASSSKSTNIQWASERWQRSTEYAFVRCSGLDIQAQIFLGTQKEIAINNYGYYAEEMQYDNFTVDAMLFGVDYIVPGPQPPLPKFSNVQQSLPNTLSSEDAWAHSAVTTFVTDANGIQSCRIASPFHKVARGLIPRHCLGTHLPSEACHQCWTKDGGSSRPHILDGTTPLSGFVVHASVRDPLDLNVDRYNLTVLGRLISIFTKPKDAHSLPNGDFHGDGSSTTEIPVGSNHSIKTQSSLPSAFGMSHQSIDDSGRSTMSGRRISKTLSIKKLDEVSIESAYPTYMKPEKIQIAGLHIADMHFRLHVLRENRNSENGRSYCYWDVSAKCATLDLQLLSATERPFQDIRFDIAHLTVHQFKGVGANQIISFGVRPSLVEFDDATAGTVAGTELSRTRSPWPTTAAAIMDIMPPLESMVYTNREYHGLQVRYLAVVHPSESVERSRKDVNIRVGPALVEVDFKIKDEIMIVINEVIASLLGPPKPTSAPMKLAKAIDSILKYKVVSDGGRLDLKPLISANLPRTISQGEISKNAGFSIESFLDNFRIAYRKSSPIRMLDQGLSLKQLAALPDNVRLRVLLFLKDLKPLEAALGLPETQNSFMRCRAVNHGIVQTAESHRLPDKSRGSRRQALIGELLMLDDTTLGELLALHRNMKNNSLHGKTVTY